jgi:hypothetical protein
MSDHEVESTVSLPARRPAMPLITTMTKTASLHRPTRATPQRARTIDRGSYWERESGIVDRAQPSLRISPAGRQSLDESTSPTDLQGTDARVAEARDPNGAAVDARGRSFWAIPAVSVGLDDLSPAWLDRGRVVAGARLLRAGHLSLSKHQVDSGIDCSFASASACQLAGQSVRRNGRCVTSTAGAPGGCGSPPCAGTPLPFDRSITLVAIQRASAFRSDTHSQNWPRLVLVEVVWSAHQITDDGGYPSRT